ncbi:MAG: Trm112 family protein [Planctomycetota bacterium]|jgi:uncharacterized protein YbaR (Trm112 family)|nr:Trm112 family protein [Planctomycetota bacterium]MDP6988472.1 Trm112 family protein [Planctomycetota bacterium]
MIAKKLLEILACPKTHQPLRMAEAEELEELNEAIAASKARTVAGEAVPDPIEAGLVREDGKLLYPIRDGIPVLLVDEGIRL